MTHSYVWHDSLICVILQVTWHVQHDKYGSWTWHIHMCDMPHSHVWHDSFACATWLIHMCDMTHSHVWHDSFTCVTWHVTWHMQHDKYGSTHLYGTWHRYIVLHRWMRHDTQKQPYIVGIYTPRIRHGKHRVKEAHRWMRHDSQKHESCHI